MADKKTEKRDAAPAAAPMPMHYKLLIGLGVFFLGVPYLAQMLGIGGEGAYIFDPEFISSIQYLGISLVSSLQAISAFISLLLIMGIIYAKFRLGQVKREAKLKSKVAEIQTKKAEEVEVTENKKWKRVIEHVNSTNPSDWRLAILEADILLGEVLEKAGYKGDSIGDKLKTVERSDFETIDQAWEAHKMRNAIAHEGVDYPLNQGEAKRIISLFEEVFREFYYI